jgi:methyl-accepting chemotaxis protein
MNFLLSSLRRQLLAAFALVAVLFLAALFVGYSGVGSVRSKVDTGAKQLPTLEKATGQTRDMALSELWTANDIAKARDHASDIATFKQTLSSLRANAATPSARSALSALDQSFSQWQAIDNQVVLMSRAHRHSQAVALFENKGNEATDALTTKVEALSASISSANTHAAASTASSSKTLMLILALVAVALAAAIAFLIARDISARTNQLLDGIRSLYSVCLTNLGNGLDAMSRGDLTVDAQPHTQPIATTRTDEIGELTRTFNDMVDTSQSSLAAYNNTRGKVAEMLQEITRTSEQIASASQQMASTSEEAGRAVVEIAQAVSSVAEGAEDQVRSIGEARHLSDEVAAVTQATAEGAEQTARAAVEARDLAEDGAQAVSHATEAMNAVRESSSEASSAIRALDAKSAQIGEIVDTITGIAEQTNLLALNAAIEAARVGEQGRGFAVVAEEVRKLAEESQSAAESIARLIQAIQHETRHVVEVVEQGAAQTADGVATVEQARDSFARISRAVEDMSGRVTEIAGQVQRIAETGTQMQDSMTSVAAVAEQSSASTEQVSASTEQTTASAQQIAASAGDLARTAEQLEQLVGQFTLA